MTIIVAIRPLAGRRVILHEGGQTLDGLAIAPGGDLPQEGGLVARAPWVWTRLHQGDAELIPAGPADEPADAPLDAPADASADAPADAPADASADAPADAPSDLGPAGLRGAGRRPRTSTPDSGTPS